jgi:hypothetical protein
MESASTYVGSLLGRAAARTLVDPLRRGPGFQMSDPVAARDVRRITDISVVDVHPRIDRRLKQPNRSSDVQRRLKVSRVVALVPIQDLEGLSVDDLVELCLHTACPWEQARIFAEVDELALADRHSGRLEAPREIRPA